MDCDGGGGGGITGSVRAHTRMDAADWASKILQRKGNKSARAENDESP